MPRQLFPGTITAMNHMIRPHIHLVILMAFFSTGSLTTAANASLHSEWIKTESTLLADLRPIKRDTMLGKVGTLLELAMVRERLQRYDQAIDTWALAKKLYGPQKPTHLQSGAQHATVGQLADFFTARIRRKQSVKRAQLSRESRLRIAQAARAFGDNAPVDQLDLSVHADLDGDGIDEIFFIGSNGPLGKRVKNSMGIARWNGSKYAVAWRGDKPIPFMVHVVDEDGDGWKEIFCGYTPDSDDAATLYFNGKTALFF